jgi:DHA3 family macrolide efflux protein-like MFS transporter
MPVYGIMMVDVGTAILAILPLIFIRIPLPARAETDPGQESVWRDLRQGLEYILNWRGLTIIIGMAMVTRLLMMPAFSLLPLLVSEHFGGTAAQLGFLESVLGVGMLLGGLILSIWGGFRRKIYTTMAGIVFLGLGLIVFGIVPGDLFVLALICTFFIGLAVPFVDGPLMAILQATVAPEIQGRVFTLMGSLISLAMPIGLIIAGPLSDIVNIRIWYVLAGLAYVLMGAALFFVPDVIHMEDRGQGSSVEPGPAGQ